MTFDDYIKAQKMGLKAFKSATSKGQYPYLPVLDEILSHVDIDGEVSLGTVNIPINQIVGTSTAGRTQAFAHNFMPLLDYRTEFGSKWANLYAYQVSEGIHDTIKVYEYMNRYYVIEGNKRVSVLKYLGCPTIVADVIRKVPRRTDDLENQIYYEFMDFYKLTKINYLQFSKLGSYENLLSAVGKNETEEWTEDERMDFSSFHVSFYKAFKEKGGLKLDITTGDALLFYLSLYPYAEAKEMIGSEIKANLEKIWSEIVLLGSNDSVELLMDPTEEKTIVSSVLNKIISTKEKRVAFVYDKNPSISNWTYGHELGRLHLDDVMRDVIQTERFVIENTEEDAEAKLEEICNKGFDIIFTITPALIKASLFCAAAHPDIKILNCALNSSHNSVRTYYTRMYEAKFLTGMIAGIMCDNDRIGYIADYPIFGAVANVNAFALGAKMTNPRAKVYLTWSSVKNFDIKQYYKDNRISCISTQDMITPDTNNRQYGLYLERENEQENLAVSISHWGAFYEELINSIFRGSWKVEDSGESKALNYWWGLSAGVIDVICSSRLPIDTKKLINIVKHDISHGIFHPFTGPITDQEGKLRCDETAIIKPEDIITMDWLVENVIGEIPTIDSLQEGAQAVVELRGVEATEKGGSSVL